MSYEVCLLFIRGLRAAGYSVQRLLDGKLSATMNGRSVTVDPKRLSVWGDGQLVHPVAAIMADMV
jgi:hypothetical protein